MSRSDLQPERRIWFRPAESHGGSMTALHARQVSEHHPSHCYLNGPDCSPLAAAVEWLPSLHSSGGLDRCRLRYCAGVFEVQLLGYRQRWLRISE